MVDKKIYYAWIPLTHRDLRSQSWTIEIMDILFDNIGSHVANKYFPPSSYSKNKNEMMGKIITPLQSLSKKYFKKKLEIKCSWSLNNFELILEKVPDEIWVIKKIGVM